MKIVIGSDHAGFNLKQRFIDELVNLGHEIEDKGAYTGDEPANDYHLIGAAVAESVVRGEAERGVVICGTGIGISIAANKVPGAHCALCNDLFTAHSSREHNNANVLAIGARIVDEAVALEILRIWISSSFEEGRHNQRNKNISKLEKQYHSRLD